MFRVVCLLLLNALTWLSFSTTGYAASSHCLPESKEDQLIYRDHQIFHSKEELKQSFETLYRSGRRLHGRLFFDETKKIHLAPYGKSLLTIPNSFLEGVTRHIEKALKNSYVDHLFYPDMGHGHIYLPLKEWENIKASTSSTSQQLNMVLKSPSVKVLYHTAELLQIKEGDFATGDLPSDPWKLWRYFSRNLFGHFGKRPQLEVLYAGSKKIYNTVREISGHVDISIFYLSSTKNGCLSYLHSEKQHYYDLSFKNIPHKPTQESRLKKN